jgi:hypothetical protein
MRRRLQESAPITTLTSWADIAAGRTEGTLQAREDEEGIAQPSGQAELVDRDYRKHCASHQPDGRSGQVVDNAQVDLTKQAARYNMELPSLPTKTAPAPRSNLAILVENSEEAVEERRDVILPHLQIAQYQATQEITATDMVVGGSVAEETR